LTAEQNAELYGKCNNPFGHGHDYVLEISVRGAADPVTGRVVNPGKLDAFVNERVLDIFDHRDMTTEVPELAGKVATTENLALDIERRLRHGWRERLGPADLDRVQVQETRNNVFELRDL
jgi:6-pyruvoyltetrahydropterin/6-carboxytetrahydropterin synthase